MRALRWTAGATVALTFVLIVLGAVVRLTGSGLSCPDWPTCYGYWVPLPGNTAALPDVHYTYTQIMLEWVHRLIAGVFVGPLILAIAVIGWRLRRLDPVLPRVGIALVVLVVFQGLIGKITVLDQNSPWSVALHLGTALVLFAMLLFVFERARGERAAGEVPTGLRALAAGVWLLALAAMVSAAMTAKSGASLACSTWPLCDGAVIPDLADPQIRIHFLHRVLSAGVGLCLVGLFVLTRRGVPGGVRGLASWGLGLVAGQILLGALLVLLYIPLWLAVAHQALGVLIFAVLSLILWRALEALPARRGAAFRVEGDVGLRRA
jgi:heme a synthase